MLQQSLKSIDSSSNPFFFFIKIILSRVTKKQHSTHVKNKVLDEDFG